MHTIGTCVRVIEKNPHHESLPHFVHRLDSISIGIGKSKPLCIAVCFTRKTAYGFGNGYAFGF